MESATVQNFDLQNIVTPVKVDVLNKLLSKTSMLEQDREFLVSGFTRGFDLLYEGPQNVCSYSKNLPFRIGDECELWQKLLDEVKLGHVAGPFTTVPFETFIQSPIGLVPKDNGTKTQLIFHLSHDFSDHGSVNSYIPAEICSVKYNDLDVAIRLILKLSRNGKNVFMSKTDGKSAFRVLPLNKQSWRWLVMKAKDPDTGVIKYFVDKCLPFGSSISCALFQKVSDGLKCIAQYRIGRTDFLTNYLDDFLFLATLLCECNRLLWEFIAMCEEIGFPLSTDKTFWADLRMVFLGILLNGQTLTLSIPLEKRTRALDMIQRLMHKNKATVHELQQLCGFLNFLNRVIFPGRALTRRMYSKFAGKFRYDVSPFNNVKKHTCSMKLKAYHHVRLDSEFCLDCKVWFSFLNQKLNSIVNRPMIDLASEPISATHLGFYSDASANPNFGFGCIMGDHWIGEQWEPNFIRQVQPSIEYLELFALCAGIITWEFELRNLRLLVHCDNQAVVAMINNLTSSCPHCMYLIRLLVLNGLQFNRRLHAQYVTSQANFLSDSISRRQWSHFWKLALANMRKCPDQTSEKIWPVSRFRPII